MIELKNVSVHYGETVAVDGVCLEIASGEILGLLGPSGCGKSSLLRAVAGLVPSTGTITINGADMRGVPVHERNVGVVFQDGQLFPHRSVAGNIAYGLTKLDKPERDARVGELLELVGLAGMADRPVTTLSGGQAQRVALARSLAPRPAILLLDEPLSALDRELREHLSVELRQILQATSTTAMYVTHDQDEAFTVADRVGVMFEGEIAELGTLAELSQTTSEDVADFLDLDSLVRASDGHVAVPEAGDGFVRVRTVGAGRGRDRDSR